MAFSVIGRPWYQDNVSNKAMSSSQFFRVAGKAVRTALADNLPGSVDPHTVL